MVQTIKIPKVMPSKSLCQAVTKKNQPCPWNAKPGCNGFCKIHKANAPIRKDNVETFQCEAVDLKSEKDALCELKKQELMDKIEKILQGVKQTKQYRDKTKKLKFNLEWAFLMGYNCSALGAKSFETPHNFKKGKGVCVTPVEERKLPKWKQELWALSKELITLTDPDFAAGEYVVNFASMTKPEQYVKKHVDSEDISHQYALTLGNYRNAYLRCYDEEDNVLGEFDYHRKIFKMDGRLPHEVISENFEGERFTIVWFKTYDHRKTEPDLICKMPCFVD